MITQLSVTSAGSKPFADPLAAIATLPMSLRATPADADLVGLRGAAGWPGIALEAIRSGARGVLVVDPVADETSTLEQVAADSGVPVVLDTTWAYNPAVRAAVDSFVRLSVPGALVEVRSNLPLRSSRSHALLDQLSLVRAAVGAVESVQYVRFDTYGFDAIGTLENGSRVTFAAILTNSVASSATVRIVRPTDAVELFLPAPTTAAPGRAVVCGPNGETLLPTKYETGHRVAWRELHASALAGALSGDLAGFSDDVRLVQTASSGS